ncbi:cadherin domain-containing protein [Alphaproteobacteria bacterium LSUCC0684]
MIAFALAACGGGGGGSGSSPVVSGSPDPDLLPDDTNAGLPDTGPPAPSEVPSAPDTGPPDTGPPDTGTSGAPDPSGQPGTGPPDPGPVTTVSGRVYDGPVAGAKVYIDANRNGVLDDGDVFIARTDGMGFYSSDKVPEEVAGLPLLAEMNGAVDIGDPDDPDDDVPITGVWRAPARPSEDTRIISPLTDILVREELAPVREVVEVKLPETVDVTTYDPFSDDVDPEEAEAVIALGQAVNQVLGIAPEEQKAAISAALDEQPEFMRLTAAEALTGEGETVARKLADIGFTDDALGTNRAVVNTVEVGGKTLFEIRNGTELWLKAGVELDHETQASHTVTIKAVTTGHGNPPPDQIFSLHITDTDEHAPVFTGSPYEFYLVENRNGSDEAIELGRVQAEDADGTAQAPVYGLKGGPPGFAIDADSGVVSYTGSGVDHEGTASVSLVVTATTGNRQNEIQVLITVTDENDVLKITSGATGEDLPENTTVEAEKAVYTAEGTYDLTAIIWSLQAGDDDGLFEIDKNSGKVTFKAAVTPDFETKATYTFTVRATSGSLTADKQVTLAVEDVDEVPTAMTLTASTGSVAEGVTAARQLADIGFTDDVPGVNTATVNTVEVGGKILFEIREGTELWLKAGVVLDHETQTSHVVTVTPSVSGTGSAPAAQTFTLQVTDADEAPVFSKAFYEFMLDEHANGSGTAVAVGTVSASDQDAGDSTLTYRFVNGELSSGDFRIDASTGDISYVGTGEDFEEGNKRFNLAVEAVAAIGSGTRTAVVTVRVSDVDEAPTAMTLTASTASVAKGVTVARQLAVIGFTDDVPGVNTATVNTVEVGGKTLFEIRSGTELWLKAGVELDHETQASHTVTITPSVTGTGSAPAAQTFTLQVTDADEAPEKPEDKAPSEMNLSKTYVALAEGVTVARKLVDITFTDDDLGTNTATVTNTTARVGSKTLFEIRNGTELWLKAGVDLDHETATSHSSYILPSVTGTGSAPAAQTFTLVVTDVDEAPSTMTLSASTLTLAGRTTTAWKLADITFTDDDLGTNTATVNTVEVGGKTLFEIREGTELWLKAGVELDHETATSHGVTVTPSVTGTGSAPEAQTFTLNVADADYAKGEISLSANSLHFIERSFQWGLRLAEVTFSNDILEAGGMTLSDTVNFSVTRTNGKTVLWLKNLPGAFFAEAVLDYETATSHSVTLTSSINPSVTETFNLTVEDYDEWPPRFEEKSYMFSLAKDADGSSTPVSVGTVSAADKDASNNIVSYAIISGNSDGLFSINSATGEISFIGSQLNYDTAMVHPLVVAATSNGRASQVAVMVNVDDATLPAPALSLSVSHVAVYEHNVSRKLADINLSAEAGVSSFVLSDTSRFEIRNGTELWLKDGAGLDYETSSSHEVTVSVSGDPDTSASFILIVKDIGEKPSAITLSSTSLTLTEGVVSAQKLADIIFTDEDAYTGQDFNTVLVIEKMANDIRGANRRYDEQYQIADSDSDSIALFEIRAGADRNTRELWLNDTFLDYETAASHEAVMTPWFFQHNTIGPELPRQVFTLNVKDVDEAASDADVTVEIHERHPTNKQVWTASAPEGVTGGSFTLAPGVGDNDLFTIDSDGDIWIREMVDYERPVDVDANNIYRVEVTHAAAGGTRTNTEVDIVVRNLLREVDATDLTHLLYPFHNEGASGHLGAPAHLKRNTFSHDSIPKDKLPSPIVQSVIKGSAFTMPSAGPLVITWSLNIDIRNRIDNKTLFKDQADIDLARAMVERTLAEFEAAANLKFIEVGWDPDNSIKGDVTVNMVPTSSYGSYFGIATSHSVSLALPKTRSTTGFTMEDSQTYHLMTHEWGHVLGLAHPYGEVPFDDWSWERHFGVDENGNSLIRNSKDTVMSYYPEIKEETGGHLGTADIEALQFIYGAPGTNGEGVEQFLLYSSSLPYSSSLREENLGNFAVYDSNRHSITVKENHDVDKVVVDLGATIYLYSSEEDVYHTGFFISTDENPDPRYTDIRVAYYQFRHVHDYDLFTIDRMTGEIRFKESPDYENPQDGLWNHPHFARDNIYLLVVEEVLFYTFDGEERVTGYSNHSVEIEVIDVTEPGDDTADSGLAPDIL